MSPMIHLHKHLPRRTVLRGMGATIALPLLDEHDAGVRRARAAAATPAAAARRHLRAERHEHGALDAAGDGAVSS